jgi:hypothetical protein
MSPSAVNPELSQSTPQVAKNGKPASTQVQQSVPNPVYLTTEPKEDFDWKISLKGKVVAITGKTQTLFL